jgi:hypothetical protein
MLKVSPAVAKTAKTTKKRIGGRGDSVHHFPVFPSVPQVGTFFFTKKIEKNFAVCKFTRTFTSELIVNLKKI